MQVCVQVASQGPVRLGARYFGFVVGKFGHHALALFGRFVVGIGEVFDGNRLGAVVATNPVGVGQVDADGRGGVAVAAELHHVNHFGAHALNLFFAEARVDGGVVFKPLGVLADKGRALGGGLVFELRGGFPAGFQTKRVAVVFDKAVVVVGKRGMVFHPHHIVNVPCSKVARLVVFDEFANVGRLLRGFGHLFGLIQPINNLFDGFAVKTAHFIDVFHQAAVLLFEPRVKPVGNGFRVFGVGHGRIKFLGFGGGYVKVVVAGRTLNQARGGVLVYPFGIQSGVKQNGGQQILQVFGGFKSVAVLLQHL